MSLLKEEETKATRLVVEENPKYHYLALGASADGSGRKVSCWGEKATVKVEQLLLLARKSMHIVNIHLVSKKKGALSCTLLRYSLELRIGTACCWLHGSRHFCILGLVTLIGWSPYWFVPSANLLSELPIIYC
jgi:hypothetical protein